MLTVTQTHEKFYHTELLFCLKKMPSTAFPTLTHAGFHHEKLHIACSNIFSMKLEEEVTLKSEELKSGLPPVESEYTDSSAATKPTVPSFSFSVL